MKRDRKYTIVIPNERYMSARYTAAFILLLNMTGLAFFAVNTQQYKYFAGAVLIAFAVAGIFNKKLKKVFPQSISAGYFWAIASWLIAAQYWIVAGVIVLWSLNFLIKKKFEFIFSDEKLVIKTTPVKTVKWFELNNALLKDGLLTVDFKNDRIIQAEILQEESDVTNETEFNEFCRHQLRTHGLAYNL